MNREKFIKFRVNGEEETKIKERAEKAKMNISTFVRNCALNDKITVCDSAEIYRLNSSLRAIGRNINQIATVANSTSQIYSGDISSLREQFKKISESVLEYTKSVSGNGDS